MTTPPLRSNAPLEAPRIEVGVVPPTSDYVGMVRDAARAAGAEFVRLEGKSPADVVERIIVYDLTQGESAGKLGPNAIAISPVDLDCYDVVSPEKVRFRLKRAIRNLVEREQLRAREKQGRETVEILNQIGHSLSAQTSQSALLDTVLMHACKVLRADGGSIYLVETDHVRFVCSRNDTFTFRPTRPELPKDETSMAGYVASTGATLNIPDAYAIDPSAPYKPNFAFDNETKYRTRSVLYVPMNDRDGEVIGVLSLINRKQNAGVPLTSFDPPLVGAFTEQHASLARSIASQAAVSIQNYRLYDEIRSNFKAFVEASVTAIEKRDPPTGGHSKRVADLSVALARAVHDSDDKPFREIRFSERDLIELHYAAMLHDFGKVGVKEHVLLKAEKLYPWEMAGVEARFRVAHIQAELESLQSTQVGLTERHSQLNDDLGTIRKLNRPGEPPTPREMSELERISERWHLTDIGEKLLQPSEVRRLCIPRGTLSAEERLEIQKHVTYTYEFLKAIPWTHDLQRVPELAHAHHEKLDGSGYPRGLKGDEIPILSRLMTISDIFDALTAGDRPYKPSMSAERAVQILHEEAEQGKIHADAVALFATKRLWQGVVSR